MDVTIIGCSGSFAGPASPASSYLVAARHEGRTWNVVLDLGSGALGALQRHIDPNTVDAVLVSHLHVDHFIDLCGLYVMRKYQPHEVDAARPAALPVWGPIGTAAHLAAAYGNPELEDVPGVFDFFTVRDRDPIVIGPFRITPVRVEHPIESYGYRVEAGGATLAYTGDTDTCDALGELMAGADLALTDSAFVDGRDEARGIHLSGTRAAEAAVRAGGVSRLMLTHLPAWNDPQVCREQAARVWPRRVEVAEPDRTYRIEPGRPERPAPPTAPTERAVTSRSPTTTQGDTMKQRSLADLTVSAIGLGGMPMSIEGRPEQERSVRTIHAALDAGVTLIDTADAYHRDAGEVGHNESLIATALSSYAGSTDDVVVATKGGHLRPGDGSWTLNGRPDYLKEAAKASLQRLGGDAIGLYQFHRPDPDVPYEESVGALAELLDEGVIRLAGISNADPDQIRRAQQVLGGRLASVQNQFSPSFRSSLAELELCNELGVAFLPWSPLGGIKSAAGLGEEHDAFAEVAKAHGVSPQQVALAWELSLAPVVIPIPGSSRPESTTDSARAADLDLSADELEALSATDADQR